MSDQPADLCSDCGRELGYDKPGQPRQPCPNCGSTNRIIRRGIHSSVTLSSHVDARLVRAWDSNSLTLAGVLFGILATVAAVLIPESLTAKLIFAGIVLGLLGAGLLIYSQRVIAAMRWLLERGKR